MEATVDGDSNDGVFAAAINAIDGMVAVVSTAAAQLMMTTAIDAATMGRRRQCHQCHCHIVPPSHHHPHQQQLPSTKTTIATAAINCRFHQG
jgi:hypothetical protein